jgi:hypothetical protein
MPVGAAPEYHPHLEDPEIRSLQRLGLANPETDLRHDLQRHPELIPYKGLQGLPMRFYDYNSIFVLNDRWVFAEFDDGHVNGSGVFEYHVEPGGRITWSTVKCAMY